MAWYNDAWAYRVAVTVQGTTKVPGNLTDYPMFVDLSNIQTGHGFWGHVKTDGGDIRATLSDGITEVPVEVVSINIGTEVGEVHLKITGTLTGLANTIIYLYYGNALASIPLASSTYGSENVWTDYLGVWHMDDESDSSSSGLDGTLVNSAVMSSSDGQLSGNSLQIAGGTTDSRMTYTEQFLTDYSIAAWIKRGNTGNSHIGVLGDTDYMWWRWVSSTAWRVVFNNSGDKYTPVYFNAVQNQWIHYVFTRSGTTNTVYVDGVQEDATSTNHTAVLGLNSWGSDAHTSINGNFDEGRIAASEFSDDWALTTYNNQSSPSTFYSIGSEEENASLVLNITVASF